MSQADEKPGLLPGTNRSYAQTYRDLPEEKQAVVFAKSQALFVMT
jgi:hypothetical protein